MRVLLGPVAGCALALWAPAAAAQDSVFSAGTLHGFVEVGAGAADGEAGWLDGGFGKAAYGDEAGLRLNQAVLEWRPGFGFGLGGVLSVQAQPQLDPAIDVDEAYLKFRAPPSPRGSFSARAGVFYPPISLEHAGAGWSTTELLSASAINSWVGEEVKVGGAEATYDARLGEHRLAATAGAFGWNDTSGTLLSFRGWALHGVRTGVGTDFRLPPLSPFMTPRQAPVTSPMWEIDRRVGYYGRLEWRPPAPLVLDAFYYDNRGDRIGVRDVQWAWETRFANLGAVWRVDDRTEVRAQAMDGRTWMGFATPQVWVDVGFRSAYLMGVRDLGGGALSARLDAFETFDHTWRVADNNDERGWAASLGYRRAIAESVVWLVEGQRIVSDRPSRALLGEDPRQAQSVVQSALRLSF